MGALDGERVAHMQNHFKILHIMKQILLILPILAFILAGCTPAPQARESMNNEVIDAIMARRSIRAYRRISVAEDTILQILT